MQIIARIRELFDIDLPIQSFFLTPTVDGITQALSERAGNESPLYTANLSEEMESLSTEDAATIAQDFSSLLNTETDLEPSDSGASLSGQVHINAQSGWSPEERYRLVSVSRIPSSLAENVLYASASGIAARVPTSFAEALCREKRFFTLKELTERMLKDPHNQVGREAVRNLLNQLIEKNLFMSEKVFVESFARNTQGSTSDPHITTLGIVSCNRPQSLQRSLESYMENCQTNGKTLEFLVIDNSVKHAICLEYRERLQSLRGKFNLPIAYAGAQELKQFAVDLGQLGDIPRSVLEFALLRPPHSSVFHSVNRNALLLATAGELVFNVDDDTLCQTFASPSMSKGLGVLSGVRQKSPR